MSPARPPDDELSEKLGHRFADPSLLELALTHPSAAHERDGTRGNERLEFLGDAVLDLVVAEWLYRRHPDWQEGDLTRARAALVNKESLAARFRELALAEYLVLGRTEEGEGRRKDSVLANAYEAVIGAIYLDAGLAAAVQLVGRSFEQALEDAAPRARDPKTRLQEWAHARFRETPRYETVDDSGVDDDEARFTVRVQIGTEEWGCGRGRSKRNAERDAAEAAWERALEDER